MVDKSSNITLFSCIEFLQVAEVPRFERENQPIPSDFQSVMIFLSLHHDYHLIIFWLR